MSETIEADRDVSTVAAASEPVPTLTPERQRLAETIEAVAALEAEILPAQAAVPQALDARLSAFRAREEAERVLERSKPRQSSFTPSPKPPGAFWGSEEAYERHVEEESTPPVPIGEAREALARAQDAYDSAVRAEQFHKDRLENLQQTLRIKQSSIKNAVRGVLRADPALLALAQEAKRLGTRARAAVYAFENAIGGDVVQPRSPYYGYNQPANSFREDPEGWALARAWGEALTSLQADPSTPLPMPEDHR